MKRSSKEPLSSSPSEIPPRPRFEGIPGEPVPRSEPVKAVFVTHEISSTEEDEPDQDFRSDEQTTLPIEIPDNPIEDAPTFIPESSTSREIAEGIKIAFKELRPQIKELVREVYEELTGNKPEKPKPDIEYNERQHWLKFALQLFIPILLFVVATAMYVWLTGRLFVTIPAVVILAILLWFGVRYLARKQKKSVNTEKKKRYVLLAMFGLALVILLLCVGISLMLALFGVSFAWSVVYLVGCAALIYYSYRLHYMWSQLWFTRDGGVIHASRPENTIYFLPTFNKDLFLENVNDANDAQTWPEEGLGIYRIHISLDAEMPDKKEDPLGYQNAKFWRRLSFIVNGAQLRAAIKQGAQYRRR